MQRNHKALRQALRFAQRHALQVADHHPGHRWLREMPFSMHFAAVARGPKWRVR